MGLKGCITPSQASYCCFLDICFDCWIAFDQSDEDLVNSIHLGNWLGFFILHAMAFYNIWWAIQERRVYYKVAGADYLPVFGFDREFIKNQREHEAGRTGTGKDELEMTGMAGVRSVSNTTGAESDMDTDTENKDPDSGDDDVNDNTAEKNKKKLPPVCYPWFRLAIAGYCSVTGFFAIFRSEFQLGKPVLIAAAGHNLFEWAMVSFAYYQHPRGRYLSFLAEMTLIWFVIVCVVMIPKFPAFVLAEQVTGITLDFLLPFTWWSLARQNWNDEKIRNMYLVAWFAHFIHLWGTIIPLVIENLIIGQSYYFSAAMEFMVFLTVVGTLILYTSFVPKFQTYVVSTVDYPAKFVAPKFKLYVGISFFLGLLTTTIIPAAIGECDH